MSKIDAASVSPELISRPLPETYRGPSLAQIIGEVCDGLVPLLKPEARESMRGLFRALEGRIRLELEHRRSHSAAYADAFAAARGSDCGERYACHAATLNVHLSAFLALPTPSGKGVL